MANVQCSLALCLTLTGLLQTCGRTMIICQLLSALLPPSMKHIWHWVLYPPFLSGMDGAAFQPGSNCEYRWTNRLQTLFASVFRYIYWAWQGQGSFFSPAMTDPPNNQCFPSPSDFEWHAQQLEQNPTGMISAPTMLYEC